jgi:CheY-like chemotaxis protein
MDQAATRFLVLVVDDDARAARLLAIMLREDGFRVEVAVDGAAAVRRLSRDPVPNALVTDLHLSHADGITVARYARSRRESIGLFLVTGYPDLAP